MYVYTHVRYAETEIFFDILLEDGGEIRETVIDQLGEQGFRSRAAVIVIFVLTRNGAR